MMNNQNMQVVASFIIGLLVGVGGYWLVAHQSSNVSSSLTANDEATSSLEAGVIVGDNGVLVSNQMPGNSVKLNQVVLKKAGWVAVHDDINGEPGKILGAKLFGPGTSEGTIELLRGTVEGKTYLVVIHSDDG